MSVVISSKCTWTIGDTKPARTSPYDGTEPVILLRPEDMRARLNHQLTMYSLKDLKTYSYNNDISYHCIIDNNVQQCIINKINTIGRKILKIKQYNVELNK